MPAGETAAGLAECRPVVAGVLPGHYNLADKKGRPEDGPIFTTRYAKVKATAVPPVEFSTV